MARCQQETSPFHSHLMSTIRQLVIGSRPYDRRVRCAQRQGLERKSALGFGGRAFRATLQPKRSEHEQ